MLRCLYPLLFVLALTGCSTTTEKRDVEVVEDSVTVSNVDADLPKLIAFRNIEEVRKNLSSIGLGGLGSWKEDELGGYMSITPYHEFGPMASNSPLQNNLAIYLESPSEDYVKTLKIVLNVNVSRYKKGAMKEYSQSVVSALNKLSIEPPKGLKAALLSGQKYHFENEQYIINNKPHTAKIDWCEFFLTTK